MKWIYAVVVILIVALIVGRCVKNISSGQSCCGTREKIPAKVKNKNRSDYPFQYVLNIEGMICSACVRNVENTLNKTEGLLAKADLQKKEVIVFSVVPRDKAFFIKAYEDSTYTITGFKKVRNIEET